MLKLKLRKVGANTVVILPKAMRRHLHAKVGQEVFVIETPNGYTLTTLDPRVLEQVEAGEVFIDGNLNTFAALTK